MTTAFQYVFDNAESLSINRQPLVGQTISRDFTVRSVVHGTAKRRFTVKLPDGMPWDLARPYIDAIVLAGRYTVGTITISPETYGDWYRNDTRTYSVICTNLPEWTITARNQVSWSGAFEFIEVTV